MFCGFSMDHIFQTGHNQKHLLYSMGEHIVLRRIQSKFLPRPTYLAHDFNDKLCGALLDSTIYYAYLTVNDTLSVRSTASEQPLYVFQTDECHHYKQPELTAFHAHIVLLYCVENPLNMSWDVCYAIFPGSREVNSSGFSGNETADALTGDIVFKDIITGLTGKPRLSVLNTDTHLIVDIQEGNENHMWELTSDLSLISHDEIQGTLKQQSIWQLDKIRELTEDMGKLQQASNLMMNKISSLLEENEALRKECASLKDEQNKYLSKLKEQGEKLKSMSASLNETNKALTIREAQIESAKQQYNELMDVAQKYRDEAIKWRMKLVAR